MAARADKNHGDDLRRNPSANLSLVVCAIRVVDDGVDIHLDRVSPFEGQADSFRGHPRCGLRGNDCVWPLKSDVVYPTGRRLEMSRRRRIQRALDRSSEIPVQPDVPA